MSISAQKTKEMIQHIKAGHAIHDARAMASISLADYAEDGDLKIKAEKEHALLTSRLKENLMAAALDSNDIKIISSLLEQRESERKKQEDLPDPRMSARALCAVLASLPTVRVFWDCDPDDEFVRVPDGHIAYVVRDTPANRERFAEAEAGEVVPPFRSGGEEQGESHD